MKQAMVKLHSGEYLIQEVPDKLLWVSRDNIECDGFSFPLNGLKLLGADPVNLTEEEAGEIVEKEWDGTHHWYKDYLNPDTMVKVRPTKALDSLAASLGISKPYVILKNVEK